MPPSGLQPSPLEIVKIVEHQLGVPVPIQTVEGPTSRMLIMGQSAGPEATLRIAGSMVHPGSFRRHLGKRTQFAVWR